MFTYLAKLLLWLYKKTVNSLPWYEDMEFYYALSWNEYKLFHYKFRIDCTCLPQVLRANGPYQKRLLQPLISTVFPMMILHSLHSLNFETMAFFASAWITLYSLTNSKRSFYLICFCNSCSPHTYWNLQL